MHVEDLGISRRCGNSGHLSALVLVSERVLGDQQGTHPDRFLRSVSVVCFVCLRFCAFFAVAVLCRAGARVSEGLRVSTVRLVSSGGDGGHPEVSGARVSVGPPSRVRSTPHRRDFWRLRLALAPDVRALVAGFCAC